MNDKLKKLKDSILELKKKSSIKEDIIKVGEEVKKLDKNINENIEIKKESNNLIQLILDSLKNNDINEVKDIIRNSFEDISNILSKDKSEPIIKSFEKTINLLVDLKKSSTGIDYIKLKNSIIEPIETLIKLIISLDEEPNEIFVDYDYNTKKPKHMLEIYDKYKIERTIEYNNLGKVSHIINTKK